MSTRRRGITVLPGGLDAEAAAPQRHEPSAAERTDPVLPIELLDFEDIEAMPLKERHRYLAQLQAAEFDANIPDRKSHYRAARRYLNRCTTVDDITGVRCDRERYRDFPRCIEHSTVEDWDDRSVNKKRADAAVAVMADNAEKAAEFVVNVFADPENVSVRDGLKAAEMIFDRIGAPKLTVADVHVTGQVEVTSDAAAIIASRLDQLAAAAAPTVIEGEVASAQELPAAEEA